MVIGVIAVELGEYLKSLRTTRGLSTTKVKMMCGVNASYLSQIENGKKKPSPDTLKKLAPVYRVSYEELMVNAGYLPADHEPKPGAVKKAHLEQVIVELERQLAYVKEELRKL